MNPQPGRRIEVCGGIASGKTTFARLLKSVGVETILEDFQANPFLEAFYCDRVWHAFETEVTFLLQHYHQIKVSSALAEILACDFSLLLDRAYADLTLYGSKREAFLAVYNEVINDLPNLTLLIHLQWSASTQLERIRKRGPIVEESLNLEYLDALNSLIERHIHEVRDRIKIISIDSERKNFADDETVRHDMIKLVSQALPLSGCGSICYPPPLKRHLPGP